MNSNDLPVITIMGPTASGKTDLALMLATDLDCEIVSVDSALIYKNMDIGTAKPSKEEQAQVKHWLLDIADPAESYSVADFCRDATDCIFDIHQRRKIPVLVGGTMMYYNALINGMSVIPESLPDVREHVHSQAAKFGWEAMHERLKKIDPIVAARVHPNDPQRIGRAIEVFEMTNKPLSEWQKQRNPGLAKLIQGSVFEFAIAPHDRKVLHERINHRFLQMLESGFIEEVETLKTRNDLHIDLPSIRCVGYRQVWQYLDGDIDYQAMIDKGVAATRQLAKRQFTWLRGWRNVTWLDTFSEDNADRILQQLKN